MLEESLDFDDILIIPKKTNICSRKDVNLKKKFMFDNGMSLNIIPIMASNMDTVGTFKVMESLAKNNLFTTFHKFITILEIKKNIELLKSYPDNYAFSFGINDFDKIEEFNKIINFKVICLDVANGYISKFIDLCDKVRKTYPNKIIIAGNVVTKEGVYELFSKGIDIVKVGIGGGSACTTRIKTGVGIPQASAIIDCDLKVKNKYIISDGGIKCPGDLGKAFGLGADFVMIGGQFAGHDENPGEIIIENGKKYKLFYGMSSSHSMKKNYGGVERYRTSEGRCLKIKYKGNIDGTIDDFLGGLRSTCTYLGIGNIEEFKINKINFKKVRRQFNNVFSS